MRYLVGFVLGLALVASPPSVNAQHTQAPSPWLESELDLYGLKTERRTTLCGRDGILVASRDDPAQGGTRGRLDDFYPGTLPEPDFDQERLHDFYPEDARKAPGPIEPAKGRLPRGARIGLGVGISVLAVGIALGAAAAVTARNIEVFGR